MHPIKAINYKWHIIIHREEQWIPQREQLAFPINNEINIIIQTKRKSGSFLNSLID